MADDDTQTWRHCWRWATCRCGRRLDLLGPAFHEAADIARRAGRWTSAARAALGSGGRHQWATARHDTRLIPLLQDALVLLGGQDETLRVRLLTRLACAWRSSPERRNDSAALSRQAIDIARRLDDPATLGYTLTGRFWATWWPENPEEREAVAREVLAIAEPLGEERADRRCAFHVVPPAERGGAYSRGRASADPRPGDRGAPSAGQVWLAPTIRSALALLEGDVRGRRGIDRAGSQVAVLDHARAHEFLPPGCTASSCDASKAEWARRRPLPPVHRRFPWYPMFRSVLVCLLLDLGEVAEARAEFEERPPRVRGVVPDNSWLLGPARGRSLRAAR